MQTLDAVAARADLRIDLEPALQLRIVEMAEDAAKGPVLPIDVHFPAGRPRRADACRKGYRQ